MADTTTARKGWVKPEPGASTNTWGLKLNTNLDNMDLDWDTASDASTPALRLTKGGTGATTAAGARTALGLGTMAVQANTAVNIDGGTIDGITDLAVADGGTGASDAAGARANIGLGTVATESTVPVAKGGTGATDATTARVNLGITGGDPYSAQGVNFTAAVNTAYLVTAALVVVTLPASPTNDDWVKIANGLTLGDVVTVAGNGHTINGSSGLSFAAGVGWAVHLVYRSATGDWRIISRYN